MPDVGMTEMHTHVDADGKSFYQHLLEHRRLKKADRKRARDDFWAEAKDKYGIASEVDSLQQKNADEEVDVSLERAVTAFKSKANCSRSREHLAAWMLATKSVNQAEAVQIIRCMWEVKIGNNMKARDLWITFMDMAVRVEAQKKWNAELLLVKDMMDEALVACWGEYSRKKFTEAEFVDAKEEFLALVVDEEDLAKVSKHVGEWRKCEEELTRIVAATSIGEKLFANAKEQITSEGVRSMITGLLETITTGCVSLATWEDLFSTLLDKTRGMEKILAKQDKEIEIHFRGVPVTVQVQNVQDELRLRAAALLKPLVEVKKMPLLPYEVDLGPR